MFKMYNNRKQTEQDTNKLLTHLNSSTDPGILCLCNPNYYFRIFHSSTVGLSRNLHSFSSDIIIIGNLNSVYGFTGILVGNFMFKKLDFIQWVLSTHKYRAIVSFVRD